MTLVRASQPDDDLDALRARLDELEAARAARAGEVAETRSELAAFRLRYRREVGHLHDQLEDLERAIAEAELGELSKLVDESGGQTATPRDPLNEPAPRFTSDAVRKLFRDVAKTIHPDLARDALTRDQRHRLMVEANRAYALGDEERLRAILDAWQRSPEAVQGTDDDAMRQRLIRRIGQIDEQLTVYASDLAEMKDTPLWKLKAMVDEASSRGKDLVADTVRRLNRDIMAARNRLDAMRWNA